MSPRRMEFEKVVGPRGIWWVRFHEDARSVHGESQRASRAPPQNVIGTVVEIRANIAVKFYRAGSDALSKAPEIL